LPRSRRGAVYPVPESDFVIEPFAVPAYFRKAYGMDVGWNNTAAVWIAHDPEADIVYITSDYKRGQCEPSSHAAAIRARGELPGLIDPASQGRGQDDGKKLVDQYRRLGLDLTLADNAVEAGLFDVYIRLTTGRLKVFKTCQLLIEELRLYRRNEKGRIVKENDHCCDALRYVVRSGLGIAIAKEIKDEKPKDPFKVISPTAGSWMSI
jgi:Terminase RNaseH-like domain